jgi:hypothetical protein
MCCLKIYKTAAFSSPFGANANSDDFKGLGMELERNVAMTAVGQLPLNNI